MRQRVALLTLAGLATLCVLVPRADAVRRAVTAVEVEAPPDSMVAGLDTTAVAGTLPEGQAGLWLRSLADSAHVVSVQVCNSPADSTEWFTVAMDTIAAGWAGIVPIPSEFEGMLYRVITNNLGTAKCYGDTYLLYTKIAE